MDHSGCACGDSTMSGIRFNCQLTKAVFHPLDRETPPFIA